MQLSGRIASEDIPSSRRRAEDISRDLEIGDEARCLCDTPCSGHVFTCLWRQLDFEMSSAWSAGAKGSHGLRLALQGVTLWMVPRY